MGLLWRWGSVCCVFTIDGRVSGYKLTIYNTIQYKSQFVTCHTSQGESEGYHYQYRVTISRFAWCWFTGDWTCHFAGSFCNIVVTFGSRSSVSLGEMVAHKMFTTNSPFKQSLLLIVFVLLHSCEIKYIYIDCDYKWALLFQLGGLHYEWIFNPQ